jgi:hypothetical protein
MADNPQNNPMSHLPKREGGAPSSLPKLPQQPASLNLPKSATPAPPAFTQPKEKSAPKKESSAAGGSKIGPAFWTIASVVSLTVNVVVLAVLVALLVILQNAKINILTLGPDLLGGLHSNFVKMDEAHITKTIPVNATIPVKFDLLLNQQTNVVLSENVIITNALVTVNTGGLNITRAAANIVLPAGTSLPVFLNLTVPVDTTIPVQLNVAVDIPLNETQLHEPFVGLQNVVAPLYCLFKADVKNAKGEMVCK